MASTQLCAIILVLLICLNSPENGIACPASCECWDEPCSVEYSSLCKDFTNWTNVRCNTLNCTTLRHLPHTVKALSVISNVQDNGIFSSLVEDYPSLQVLLIKFAADLDLERLLLNLLSLDLSGGDLKSIPEYFFESSTLQNLNISGNNLGSSGWDSLKLDLEDLQVLDLSNNKLTEFYLDGNLPNLTSVYLQGNELSQIPNLVKFKLHILDLSDNYLHESLQSTCLPVFPPTLQILNLRQNSLEIIPNVENCGFFSGLKSLRSLDLGDNDIRKISFLDFPDNIADTLESLKLDHNEIRFLPSDAFSHFKSLKFLSISHNYLRTLPIELFSIINRGDFVTNESSVLEIEADGNYISCDCEVKNFHDILNNITFVKFTNGITCRYPRWRTGYQLKDIANEKLNCFDVTLHSTSNVSCPEYEDCDLRCDFDGLPHPQTHWMSPLGELLTLETIGNDSKLNSKYSLSEDGSTLTVKELTLHLTGIYECVGENSLGSASSIVQVGVLPDEIGSVIAIVVSAVSFSIAIAVNCANMCKCYCENIHGEVPIKKEEEEEPKMESPIHSKQKGLHESVASLSANKYYRKYDFTCQHIFLDAVIKGAHTVKQTLHDARNSEFSNNVWEYASHLRDRFHIELPSSVQFPRVSMPSLSLPTISMPNISMPSMPNLQSINTNIERLGTSMISRSHTLASSVGSVFTLRWLRYGHSDNESDSASDSPEHGSDSESPKATHKMKSFPVTCIVTSEAGDSVTIERAGPSQKTTEAERAGPSQKHTAGEKSVRFAVHDASSIDDVITEESPVVDLKFYQFETSV